MKTGVRWWIRFCVKIGTEPLLYTEADLPLSFETKRSVEGKLLLFMMWMARHKHGKKGQEKKFLAEAFEPCDVPWHQNSTSRKYFVHELPIVFNLAPCGEIP